MNTTTTETKISAQGIRYVGAERYAAELAIDCYRDGSGAAGTVRCRGVLFAVTWTGDYTDDPKLFPRNGQPVEVRLARRIAEEAALSVILDLQEAVLKAAPGP